MYYAKFTGGCCHCDKSVQKGEFWREIGRLLYTNQSIFQMENDKNYIIKWIFNFENLYRNATKSHKSDFIYTLEDTFCYHEQFVKNFGCFHFSSFFQSTIVFWYIPIRTWWLYNIRGRSQIQSRSKWTYLNPRLHNAIIIIVFINQLNQTSIY